nr:hypothetical protein [Tanacetum cinerariifolium]
FWDSVRYDKTAGCYKCQLDEQWFDLTKDTLRNALQITPVNNNNAFSSPLSSDALINFVNNLGYPKVVRNLSNVVTNDMFQPWRALTTIINLCLTGKTSTFERPRASVLQILWGVVNRTHIDYVERIWEEFAQSIHTFIEEKKNLAHHTHGKKKAALIVISSIRFTKLIIYYLQRKHKFHSRPDSLLHLPNEEPVLGYLKFSAKGTKREVCGMHIPGNLIKADIQGYQKSKPSAPKADLRPPITKPASSQQPEPKPTPAKSQGKKREFVDEGIPEKEPRVDDEEADIQRALEESLKSVYDAPRGPLPLVVIREPESGKYQPLPEVQGKGKEKVTDEQTVRWNLMRMCARPNPGDQDEGQVRLNPDEQGEGQAGPNPGDAAASQPQSSPVVHAGPNLEHMDLEATYVSTQPHPEQMDEGFTATAYISFGDLFFNDKQSEADNEKTTAETKAESMVSIIIQQDTSAIPPMTTPIIDLTSRPDSPNVHQPLQETAAKSTTTITIHPPAPQPQQSTIDSMLMKRIGELEHIMANLIQNNKHLKERLDSHGARLYTLENLDIPQKVSKAVDEIVIDAVDWAIQAPLWNRFRDLPEADMKEIIHQRMWETNSYKTHEDHMMLYEALEKSINRDQTEKLLKDLAEALKKKKKRSSPSGTLGSPGASESSQVPPPPPSTNQEGQSHNSVAPSSSKTATSAEYKAWTTTDTRLMLSISLTPEDLQMDDDMALDAQVHSFDDEEIENAHIPKMIIRFNKIYKFSDGTLHQIDEALDYWVKEFKASALASTYSPPPEDSLVAQTDDMAMFIDWFCKRQGITELKPQDLEGPTFELVKVFHPNVIHLQYQMEECHKLLTDSMGDSIIRNNVSKPLPLGGPPSQIDEALDYWVKEFKVNRMNPGLNIRFWTRKDVDKSKEFMFSIHKRLKTRRIFRNLESFVGGRVRDGDYRLLKCTE